MRLVVRVLPLLAASVASTSIALHGADVWHLTRRERVAALVLLALVGLAESLARVIGGVVRERQLREAQGSSGPPSASTLSLSGAATDGSVVRSFSELAGSGFGARRRPRTFSGRSERGVIGRCWELGTDLGVDLRDHFADIEGHTAEEWAQLTDGDRLGLTYNDFQRTRQHGVVVATPVLDRFDSVIGVISADALDGPLDRLLE